MSYRGWVLYLMAVVVFAVDLLAELGHSIVKCVNLKRNDK